mgnify:CR=1 FL=1
MSVRYVQTPTELHDGQGNVVPALKTEAVKVNEKKKITFDRNAKGVREMLSMKFNTLGFEGPWYDAFRTPERRGVWFVWGNSGNGKTSFVMQLCKYLYPEKFADLDVEGYAREYFENWLGTEYKGIWYYTAE